MPDVISEYQKWKQQGENLKAQAKTAMESRFRELLSEAVSIAEEFRADFGATLKPQAPVTLFRYRLSRKSKPKKTGKQPPIKVVAPGEKAEPKPDPEVARLQRRLEAAKRKLEAAKAAGKPVRPLEDRVYEIEDALRLSRQPAQ